MRLAVHRCVALRARPHGNAEYRAAAQPFRTVRSVPAFVPMFWAPLMPTGPEGRSVSAQGGLDALGGGEEQLLAAEGPDELQAGGSRCPRPRDWLGGARQARWVERGDVPG